VDSPEHCQALSRFALVKDGVTVAAGWIDSEKMVTERTFQTVKSRNLSPYQQPVTSEQRAMRNGHKGMIVWFSGLSGSGKSTLAVELEKRLFERGCQVFVLDGDNLRGGLS